MNSVVAGAAAVAQAMEILFIWCEGDWGAPYTSKTRNPAQKGLAKRSSDPNKIWRSHPLAMSNCTMLQFVLGATDYKDLGLMSCLPRSFQHKDEGGARIFAPKRPYRLIFRNAAHQGRYRKLKNESSLHAF